jgi:hypothetical protein
MSERHRSEPMPVKYWSSAGLILTYSCNARCASCYVCCGPERTEWMSTDDALAAWRELIEASPHGCRIHLAGGEPFGDWPRLIDLCRRAAEAGLPPPEKVETNAFWATDERIVRERAEALRDVGVGTLVISADPYHQQFVPIGRVRLAARVAGEIMGDERVRVRWADWLSDGFDTHDLDDAERTDLFARYAAEGRDRFNGRAADLLAPHVPGQPAEAFADAACREALLRGRHVHVDPDGWVVPGTCAGIVLGRTGFVENVSGATLKRSLGVPQRPPCQSETHAQASLERGTRDPGAESIAAMWARLDRDHADRPIVGVLAEKGPVGLLARAEAAGFAPRPTYASKCHLCWDLRRFLVERGQAADELAPRWIYAADGRF